MTDRFEEDEKVDATERMIRRIDLAGQEAGLRLAAGRASAIAAATAPHLARLATLRAKLSADDVPDFDAVLAEAAHQCGRDGE